MYSVYVIVATAECRDTPSHLTPHTNLHSASSSDGANYYYEMSRQKQGPPRATGRSFVSGWWLCKIESVAVQVYRNSPVISSLSTFYRRTQTLSLSQPLCLPSQRPSLQQPPPPSSASSLQLLVAITEMWREMTLTDMTDSCKTGLQFTYCCGRPAAGGEIS